MADLALVAVMAIWGSSFALLRYFFSGGGTSAQDAATPLALLCARMSLASALLLVWLLARPSGRAQLKALLVTGSLGQRPPLLRDGLFAGAFLACGFVLQTEGLARTTASRSAFLTGLLVVFVPLLEFLLFKKRPAALSLVGLGIALAGMTVLSEVFAGPRQGGAQSTVLGDLLSVGGAIVFAGHILAIARFARRNPILPLLWLQLVCVALASLCLGPLIGPARLPADPRLWATILYLALFATLLAFGVQTWAQRIVSPVRFALISTLEPVFAALWAALLLGERLSTIELWGGGLILLGVIVGELPGAFAARKMAGRGTAE